MLPSVICLLLQMTANITKTTITIKIIINCLSLLFGAAFVY